LGLTARGTPDVAYDGDPETGFAVYDTYGTGGWGQYGGTSVGTPQWAALLAIVNQGRVLAGKVPLANAQAALYALPSADFHDIASGSNGQNAAAGYDLASGLGSPIADKLVPDLVAFGGSTDFTVADVVSAKVGKSSNHFTFNVNSVGASLGHESSVSVTSLVRNLTPSEMSYSLPLPSWDVAPTAAIIGAPMRMGSESRRKSVKRDSEVATKFASIGLNEVDAYFAKLGGTVAAA
jgi:hypothetical protein